MRFLNHSCGANAYVREVVIDEADIPHICVFAKRDIRVCEEVCLNYGTSYYERLVLNGGCKCFKCSGQPPQ